MRALGGLSSVETLEMEKFSGSLGFLAGWFGLKTLNLRGSGPLTDTEVLLSLSNLETVYLRGATLRSEDWPEAVRDKLDYQTRSG